MEHSPRTDGPSLGIGYRSNAESRSFLEDRVAEGGRWRQLGISVEGRSIDACEWTLGPETTGAPQLLLLSLVHPMEWIGREIHLRLIDDLLTGRIPVPSGTRLLSLVDANPDGTARVEAALRAGRPAWVRGNANGIDLNRNFPEGFRTRPGWIDFWPMWRPGPRPLSEPESQAVMTAARTETGRRRLALTLHSFGRWVFFPPSSTRETSPLAEAHARLLGRVFEAAPARGYRARQLGRYARWFRAFGTEIDTLALGTVAPSLAYLIELSWGGFGRWGVRRLPQPFYTFNPPHPDREYERVGPMLRGLIEVGLQGPAGSTAGSPTGSPASSPASSPAGPDELTGSRSVRPPDGSGRRR